MLGLWREARFRMVFPCSHDEYMNEPFQRSIIMVELADMERSLIPSP